jgi:hypothetical protein
VDFNLAINTVPPSMATLESEPQQGSSGWQRAVAKFGAYFEEKGLGAKDVPMAIVIHEVGAPYRRRRHRAIAGYSSTTAPLLCRL